MFVGMVAARGRDLSEQAQETAPWIVFISEIDDIGKRRDNNVGGNDEREQTLNQLLAEMDRFDSSEGDVILAATNRSEILDKTLLRHGCFFFQAEDGIRDIGVTGVQTCALPICSERKVPHIGTETRSKLLREAAVRNIGQWARA